MLFASIHSGSIFEWHDGGYFTTFFIKEGGEIMNGIVSIQSNTNYSSYQTQRTGNSNTLDFQEIMEQKKKEIQDAVESGEISVEDFKAKMVEDFGDAVEEAFAEDGTVDFEKLDEIIEEQRGSANGVPPSGPPPGGPPPERSTPIDAESLQSKLIEDFGEEAEGIVSDDGTIDYEKLKELLDSKMGSQVTYSSPYSTQNQNSSQSSIMNSFFLRSGSLFSVSA